MNRAPSRRRLSPSALPSFALVLVFTVGACLSHHSGPMPGEPENATFAALRETRVRYLDEGEGPTVVLIHGFGSAIEAWEPVLPVLTDFRVLALDLKGFGWTDRPEGDYSPAEQARLVLELMDAQGVDNAVVVGHSYGASVALSVALQAPDRVQALALYDAWVYHDQLPTLFHWARADGVGETLFGAFYGERADDKMAVAFHDPTIIPEALIEDVEAALARPGTRAAALAAVRDMRFEDVEGDYSTISQPTLLLWGREDAVALLEYGERLSNDLLNAELHVLPLCGHFPQIEATAQSNRLLVEFLEGFRE